ncbi:hypothetical protein [Dyadobacter sp. LHD-138]|uniref:hypothetical protein n=1 Tax=Dyadobacter sp. LHD-138 TaxID=3071413 RepID=UPI0027E00A96|nr:hypothetical protein [Dyadobacter sp. LHD-138]MDQ6477966.1 hypothetical protein [Dyadobacter sp. LHD-138]
MTYISAQPHFTDSWEDICYPVEPVWLADVLPDYDIMATDRQQIIVGEPVGGRKTIFGVQSADYAIIPNVLIREVVDDLFSSYTLQIKYTTTGEFSITVIFPEELSVGGELLHRSLILTNSYNGKTPFSIQGQTLTAMLDDTTAPGSSFYRALCQNGLMGWADPFAELSVYRHWLKEFSKGKEKKQPTKSAGKTQKNVQSAASVRKIHHSRLTPELFRQQLHALLSEHLLVKPTLTANVYERFHQKAVTRADEGLLRALPIPVQLAKQAQERLRLEERLLGSQPSYWLMYNAVNYALFNARSSLTLNDRYRLDERVFHQLAARSLA